MANKENNNESNDKKLISDLVKDLQMPQQAADYGKKLKRKFVVANFKRKFVMANFIKEPQCMEVKISRRELPDEYAMITCRPGRLFCRCGFCTIRHRLDLAGHADNHHHRHKCVYCREVSQKPSLHKIRPVVAVFEFHLLTVEVWPDECASFLADLIAQVLQKRYASILADIGFIDPFDDQSYYVGICSEVVAEKLRAIDTSSNPEFIIRQKDNKEFEDFEAFWKTGSTLKTVAETRGKCLVMANPNSVKDEKENDEPMLNRKHQIAVQHKSEIMPKKCALDHEEDQPSTSASKIARCGGRYAIESDSESEEEFNLPMNEPSSDHNMDVDSDIIVLSDSDDSDIEIIDED